MQKGPSTPPRVQMARLRSSDSKYVWSAMPPCRVRDSVLSSRGSSLRSLCTQNYPLSRAGRFFPPSRREDGRRCSRSRTSLRESEQVRLFGVYFDRSVRSAPHLEGTHWARILQKWVPKWVPARTISTSLVQKSYPCYSRKGTLRTTFSRAVSYALLPLSAQEVPLLLERIGCAESQVGAQVGAQFFTLRS